MRILNVIVAFLVCHSIYGQSKTYYNITEPNGDSAFGFKLTAERARKLSLPILDTFSGVEYIRIWTNKQVIEICQADGGIFSGKLITWTDEYVGGGEAPTNRTFSKARKLSLDTILLLNKLLKTSSILALPTGDSIVGWTNGFDGISYLIERSTKTDYSFKSYWTPTAQDSLKEALQLSTFIDNAFNLTNAQTAWSEFSKKIPFESYWNGGPIVVTKILTVKEQKKYRKERKDYRCKHLGKSRTK